MSEWQIKFPKDIKPAYDDLLAFLPDDIRTLFLMFSNHLADVFRVYNKWHRYEKEAGWVYGYCRNYRCELLSITIGDGCFRVLGVDVVDEPSFRQALLKAADAYENGYESRYAALAASRKAGQIKRTKLRIAREKEQMEALKKTVDPERFNRFKWAPKVSRVKLVNLYNGEAHGCLDLDLLDDVGYSFYARCKQGDEVRKCMDRGHIICHYCGKELIPVSYTAVVPCPCGHCYTYREYRRSCNTANIPGGRAEPVFRAFMDKWPGCKDEKEKMLLIDRLIHECHVSLMSGEKGRSVCVNLIEGTIPQLRDMLERLAGH